MDHRWILPIPEYYARLNIDILEIGLPWLVEDAKQWDAAASELRVPLGGGARGRTVLDGSCG